MLCLLTQTQYATQQALLFLSLKLQFSGTLLQLFVEYLRIASKPSHATTMDFEA